jgi:nucleoside-diphosphate-sugar epimerase
MKILVTGGRGFVGSKIAQHLRNEGHNVMSPASSELNLLDADQVNTWFASNPVDVVVHCALTGREVLASTDPVYLSDGLLMFRNLWLNRHWYQRLINLGTAYELDLNANNSLVSEDEFLQHLPLTSYGYSKNIIARIIRETPEFYNLRLFGVFHETEKPNRFFQLVKNQEHVTIRDDMEMDYIYLEDIFPVVDLVIASQCQHKDVNLVYEHKYRLSEMAYTLCDYLNLPRDKIKIQSRSGKALTGDYVKLSSLQLPLTGLTNGLRKYR